ESFRAVAIHGYPEEVAAELCRPYGANVFFQRIVDGARYVQIPDFQAGSGQLSDPAGRAALGPFGLRTWLAAPPRTVAALRGSRSGTPSAVRPLAEKELAFAKTSPAQGAFAMGSARPRTGRPAAWGRRTAPAEVLQVITSAPGDLTPVFDVILEKAH